jgi:predicted site-specific integrase-resolvase
LIEWENKGILNAHRTAGGHRRWLEDDIQGLLKIGVVKEEKRYCVYGRCSTAKQKENLDRQMERLRQHCKDKGYENVKEYSEIGSGLNDNRRQLHKLIDAVLKKEVNHIIVEYKDRLARYGFKFLMRFFKGLGCTIEFLDEKATKDDNEELVQDVLSLFTCFSAKLYGRRGGRPKGSKNKNKLKEQLQIGVNNEQEKQTQEVQPNVEQSNGVGQEVRHLCNSSGQTSHGSGVEGLGNQIGYEESTG